MGRPPKSDLPNDLKKVLTSIGRNIRALREKQDIKQAELARLAQISVATLNEIEVKCQRDIRLSTLTAIAQRLKVSVEHLLIGSDLEADMSSSDKAQLLRASETLLRISKKIQKKEDN